MNIAICTDLFYPRLEGGGEVHTYNVSKELVKLGHCVTVLCAKTSYFSKEKDHLLEDEEVINGIRVLRARKPYEYGATLSSLPALGELYRRLDTLVSNGRVDVVNFTLYRPWVPAWFATKNRVPCVPTIHLTSEGFGSYRGWIHYDGGIIGGLSQRLVESMILKIKYPMMLTVSECQRKFLSQFLPKDRIRVAYNGVDLAYYDSVRSAGKNPHQLIFIGWLKRRKNVLDAVKAVEIARSRLRNLRLLIVSGGGEYEPLIKKLSQRSDHVEYRKKISDAEKVRLLKESSLLIFPTLKEGFSLVPIEALACRTPFIAYDIPAMREMRNVTGGGALVESMNPRALANKIVELLTNRSKLSMMAERGRRAVEEIFTWQAVARKEEQAFKEAVSSYDTRC